MKQDINWLLEQWGIWARADGTYKLSRSDSAFFAEVLPRESGLSLLINDDTAMQVDVALCALKRRNPDAWRVMVMRYYYRLPKATIAKKADCGRPKVQAVIETGEAYLAGLFDDPEKLLRLQAISRRRAKRRKDNPAQKQFEF